MGYRGDGSLRNTNANTLLHVPKLGTDLNGSKIGVCRMADVDRAWAFEGNRNSFEREQSRFYPRWRMRPDSPPTHGAAAAAATAAAAAAEREATSRSRSRLRKTTTQEQKHGQSLHNIFRGESV